MVSYRRRKAKEDRIWVMVKRIVLLVLLFFFLRLVVLLVVPDPLKPTMDTSIVVSLIGTVDRYLHPVHKSRPGSSRGTDVWEGSLAQKVRDELVLTRLSEMALSEQLKPPLPSVSLFPPGKLDEYEQMRILERSRFYRELEEIVRKGEQEGIFSDVPGPKTSDVKGGTIPLPEDIETERIIASLREAAKEEGEEQKSTEAATVGIRGPAANRKVNYTPHPLEEKVSVEGDSLLKFWILPDGTVGKVILLVKGDAQATEVVINHLKKYRFNPLPADVPQVEMWGTIPVKSVLK
ncbi:MAG: hypothetical protein A2Y65_05010 [Deltaproteobacteria bacterium RBG_13_52_11]|nr:MAG: hypothetical protein A2Y65_05010 [Deltaproteobacteria bacterium RBG_13_52_11]